MRAALKQFCHEPWDTIPSPLLLRARALLLPSRPGAAPFAEQELGSLRFLARAMNTAISAPARTIVIVPVPPVANPLRTVVNRKNSGVVIATVRADHGVVPAVLRYEARSNVRV